MPGTRKALRITLYIVSYLVLYGAALFFLRYRAGFSLSEPLLILGIVGFGFSALAWWLTRGVVPLAAAVQEPSRETALLAAYLLLAAAFIAWGLDVLENNIGAEPFRSVVILAAKLAVFVLIPFGLFRALWGYGVRHFLPRLAGGLRHWKPALTMSLILIAFQIVFGHGVSEVRRSGIAALTLIVGIPLVYLWLLIEVGLVEEFFFRVLVQSRLAAWLTSEVGGVVVMAVLFGLAHAPGMYFRTAKTMEALGPHPSWLAAVSYSIVFTSVTGFFLGVLWARTRNLLLLMIVHAAGDLVPNLAAMIRNWT